MKQKKKVIISRNLFSKGIPKYNTSGIVKDSNWFSYTQNLFSNVLIGRGVKLINHETCLVFLYPLVSAKFFLSLANCFRSKSSSLNYFISPLKIHRFVNHRRPSLGRNDIRPVRRNSQLELSKQRAPFSWHLSTYIYTYIYMYLYIYICIYVRACIGRLR